MTGVLQSSRASSPLPASTPWCATPTSSPHGAHASGGQGTAYLEFPDFSLPADHPRLHFADYAVRAVAYDITPLDSPLRLLYEWDP